MANEAMTFLGWDAVRLTERESEQVIRSRQRQKVSRTMTRAIHPATGGWIAGVVLALTARPKSNSLSFDQTATEWIFDYFAAEALHRADSKTQEVLLLKKARESAGKPIGRGHLEMAKALYQGAFLPNFNEPWIEVKRQALRCHSLWLSEEILRVGRDVEPLTKLR